MGYVLSWGADVKRRLLAVSITTVISVGMLASPASASERMRAVTHEDYPDARFSHPLDADNNYLPLEPGMESTFEGTVNSGGTPALHRIVFTVTDLSKEIDGVKSRVVYDVDSTEGVVTEAELALMAQDDSGNVWNTGEYPEVFENGAFVGAPAAWLAGVDDALAGVGMRTRPRPGSTDYFQGLVPSIEFGDLASVVGFVPELCVPAGCFRNVLQIKETNVFAHDEGFQMKYYARHVGNIRIDFLGGPEEERLELVKLRKLHDGGLARARNAALRLDRRSYRVAPDIFVGTPRAVADDD